MKFSCEKALLQAAIVTASRTVALKSTIPALEGILLEANTELRLSGYNLETGIRTALSGEIEEDGSIILPARLFGEIVRKLPDDRVYFSTNQFMVHIQCGFSEFNLMGTDPEDFPELPLVEHQNSIALAEKTLRTMINQTLFAVSDNESRPIHTGSLFEVEGKTLRIISVDGFRLALRCEQLDMEAGTFQFVVPGAALSEVEKICRDNEETATVTMGARHVLFQIGDTILVARRLEGEFLSWRQAIPRNNPIQLTADTKQLLNSIERVSLIISEKLKSPLRCRFGNAELQLSTKNALGNASDCCAIEGDGEALEIGFNNKYLMDVLKAAPAERIRLELSSNISPCVISPVEGEERFLYMVLPVRIKAGE